ncbi:hypothetical protein CTAYLR_006213 [Chrysophaeum taylorii]|uniref:ASPIC/UnbV domain-containing protein n=1 Tax=Chrysophaeum taylorii TaxID=2483200 RepID=A0AAD7U6K7_9STRA|nr:hypothetical protein CTAYLR_006213 [Chrysophaeum taylorii]
MTVKAVVTGALLLVVSVPVVVIVGVRMAIMDHSDFREFSCATSIGAQCANGACPDSNPDMVYEGEFGETMNQMEKAIRGMAWKPDFSPVPRGTWKRYAHFLTHQDEYTVTNTDFYPQRWGVDLDDAEDWDLRKFFGSEFRDRVSFANSLPPPPPSGFPKWFYRWMMGSLIFDRSPTARDAKAGRYVNMREVGLRFFAPVPLCDLDKQVAMIDKAPNCEEREARMFRLSVHALSDAANEVALEKLLELCYSSCLDTNCTSSGTKRSKFLRRLIQVAYLRSGEVSNCQRHHNSESCIFPLSLKAQHVERAPATELLRWLDLEDSQESKWLRLIAEMQLGSRPALPHLPQAENYSSTIAAGKFKNVAGPLGLDNWGGTGAIAADMFLNDEGLIDFYHQTALQWPRGTRSATMRQNLKNGTFRDVSVETKLNQGPSGNIGRQADFDNDGDLDIFNGRGGWMPFFQLPNSLYENKNNSEFEEITRKAGDLTGEKGTHSAAWADFDLDGHLDLYVASEQNPCELFRNNGDKTFTEVAEEMGVAECGWVKGVAWGDLDGDGYPDLVVSSIAGPNRVLLNRQTKFVDVTEASGAVGPRFSQPVAIVDIDNDGDEDIFFGSHRPPDPGELYAAYFDEEWEEQHVLDRRGLSDTGVSRIYLNRGDATFEDVSDRTPRRLLACGVMAMNFGDIDNDGFVDFYMGTGWPDLRGLMPNIMLHNRGDGSFDDVTVAGGFGHLQKGHGIAFIDVQNDGRVDVAASMGGTLPGDLFSDALYLNPGGNDNNWIKISLVGFKSNRLGQGAKLVLRTTDRTIYSVLGNAASFGSNPIKIHHVGLGKGKLLEITVKWPHRDVLPQKFGGSLPTNAWISLSEETGMWTQKRLASFHLDADALIAHHEQHHTCHSH